MLWSFWLLWIAFVVSTPTPRGLTSYAPKSATCPATPLVRAATAVSGQEQQFVTCRSNKAAQGLQAWLKKTNITFSPQRYPFVGLTTSGGGLRSLLEGAGVVQAFDSRDSKTGVSGLYQGLTYQAGLSGGSWLLSSLAGNNYPTITSLKTGLWRAAFQNTLLVSANFLATPVTYAAVTTEIASKQLAGFPPTLTDPWGRLLSYQLLNGPSGGVDRTLSGVSSISNFTSCNVPFPIITALGVKTFQGECVPGPNATQYEFSPFEFGSWDQGVSAFTQTAYLGSSLSNGIPSDSSCITNYDNLGYVLGTSSHLFNEACAPEANTTSGSATAATLEEELESLVSKVHQITTRDLFAVYPNPFYKYSRSSLVQNQKELSLVDGGEALQNNPIWPFLHRSDTDVLIVNDNSADTSTNYPNGSEILTTYVQAQSAGLTRMPEIPSVETFLSLGLNAHPTFFGCNDDSKLTIVYLPNVNYTYASGQSTFKLQYSPAETDAMIANGVQIATKGGDAQWPQCLACGIMKKAGGTLPSQCSDCYKQYCYN